MDRAVRRSCLRAALLGASLAFLAVPARAQAPAPANDAPAAASETAPEPNSAPIASPKAEAAASAEQDLAQQTPAEFKPLPKADGFLPSALPHDLTPWGMFRHADPLVKAVMVGLALASLATWTVWLAKTIELWTARQKARRGLETLAHAASLRGAEKELAEAGGPVAKFVSAAVGELDRSAGLPPDGVKERAVALLSRIEARAGRSITRGTGVLATIGATAPFVGLFGTVWGIMDSFIGISKTNTTNLAVVAPGIAEALLATAMGLFAAIPAVVIYNVFARAIAGYRAQLGDAAAEVLRHLSRDLDREAAPRRKDDAPVVPIRQPAE
jgi:biopolymer transport protein ExbB